MAIDWDDPSIDWSRPVVEIARRLGCTPQRVYQAMKKRDIPRPRQLLRLRHEETIRRMRAQGATYQEIADVIGAARSTVAGAGRAMGLPSLTRPFNLRSRKYAWDSVDWTKSNRSIMDDLGITNYFIVWRARKKYAPDALKSMTLVKAASESTEG